MKVKLLVNTLLLLFSASISSQSDVAEAAIQRFINDKALLNANVSISIINTTDKKLITSHRPHKVLVPASSLKLLTTLSGLNYLGKDFKFISHLLYSGDIKADGTLEGDLYFRGSGDPTLGSDRIDGVLSFEELLVKIINSVKAAGINCIKGKVIIDESVFDSYPVAPTWQWNDLGNYYASGAWGTNINENQYYIHFGNRMLIGYQPNIEKVFPYIPGLNLSNEITIDSAHTGDNAYIFGGPYNLNKRIVGTIPQGKGLFSIKGSIPDPPHFFGYHIARALDEANIQNEGFRSQFHDDKVAKKNIAEFASVRMLEIVKATNFSSLNLHAECILKRMGLSEKGQGSGQNGIAVINGLMRKFGVASGEYSIKDGSGLSARNQISSYALAQFLAGMISELDLNDLLYTIPRGGIDGNVRSLFAGSKAKGQIWLKSGSMEAVQSYTGYIKTQSGDILSFSVIANGFSASGSIIRGKMAKLIESFYYLE